jgi:flagellar protein FliS
MDARTSYREVAVRGASPVRLVICLYEQAIADLRRAIMALEQGDIEARTRAINHALTVIAQLQGSLDMERGGDVAQNLQQFYNSVRIGLVEAQSQQSRGILEQQISQLMLVHEAWQEVERELAMPKSLPSSVPLPPAPTASVTLAPETSSADWNA